MTTTKVAEALEFAGYEVTKEEDGFYVESVPGGVSLFEFLSTAGTLIKTHYDAFGDTTKYDDDAKAHGFIVERPPYGHVFLLEGVEVRYGVHGDFAKIKS